MLANPPKFSSRAAIFVFDGDAILNALLDEKNSWPENLALLTRLAPRPLPIDTLVSDPIPATVIVRSFAPSAPPSADPFITIVSLS